MASEEAPGRPGRPDVAGAGLDFLKIRLRRAEAVPKGERTPEVEAFIESVQLQWELAQLLPLTAAGTPALPAGGERSRRLQLALLLLARMEYICPDPAPVLGIVRPHISVYFPEGYVHQWQAQSMRQGIDYAMREGGADPPPGAAASELEHALLLIGGATSRSAPIVERPASPESAETALLSLGMAASAAKLLQGRQAQVAAQLAQLSDRPLLTAQQLQHVCCCRSALVAGLVLVHHGDTLGQPKLAYLGSLATRAVGTLLQLEPDNPKTCLEVARLLTTLSTCFPDVPVQRALPLYLKAVRLGQQQGRDFWVARCAPAAVDTAAWCAARLSRASKAAALEAYRQAGPALARCSPLLPMSWVRACESVMSTAAEFASVVEADLRQTDAGGHSGDSSGGSGGSAAQETQYIELMMAAQAAIEAGGPGVRDVKCSGCKEASLGLRRCSRCKKAQYCSPQCQKKHWPVHKLTCVPASQS